jgi:hypothetical protein
LGTGGFVFVECAVAEPVLPVRVGLDADRAEHGSGDHGLLVVTARAAVTTKRPAPAAPWWPVPVAGRGHGWCRSAPARINRMPRHEICVDCLYRIAACAWRCRGSLDSLAETAWEISRERLSVSVHDPSKRK